MNANEYHAKPISGKIEILPTKPCKTKEDLSFAYTPGVAEPCLEIKNNVDDVNLYTNKSNLVGVVTNGSAVLGLGNIGPLAGKPVMEGKAVLFKRFADVDVFDIEIDESDPVKFVEIVKSLEPTFGGINLEDIKAPECFYIEDELKKQMNIPVFHDDQHGTAIITGAALINALRITGKNIADIKVVVNGAGAAGIACSNFYIDLGVRRENLTMCDSKGVIYKGRKEGMNPFKDKFAVDTSKRTLADALVDADLFLGLSVAGAVKSEMLLSMADNPIVFALANPTPEIEPALAISTREDVLIATGRSDYANQVNNVLGFPFIFRGALDVAAKEINLEMKKAAVYALADLTKEPVSQDLKDLYAVDNLDFGKDYLIPKPFDKRVFFNVSMAVAKTASETGVARKKYPGDEEYKRFLNNRYESSIKRFL